jgi:hypothetical protein
MTKINNNINNKFFVFPSILVKFVNNLLSLFLLFCLPHDSPVFAKHSVIPHLDGHSSRNREMRLSHSTKIMKCHIACGNF